MGTSLPCILKFDGILLSHRSLKGAIITYITYITYIEIFMPLILKILMISTKHFKVPIHFLGNISQQNFYSHVENHL